MVRDPLPERTRVAVIGGGIAGCSVLYHLALRGCADAVLLEQNELTAGSTWHAAGLCTQFAPSLRLMRLLRRSLDLYDVLEERTGQPVGLHRCGSVRLAESEHRLDQFRHVSGIAAQAGVPMQIIGPEDAAQLFPLMVTDGVLAAAYLPTDGHVDPSGATNALATGALERGARIYRHAKVKALHRERRGWSVETTRGRVHADAVVNAAGQWARQVGRLAGAELPVVPLEHHYVVTEPIAELGGLKARTPCPARCGGLLLRASGG